MSTLLSEQNRIVELEGTVEEIQARLSDFAGQRLHVTVQPVQTLAEAAPEAAPEAAQRKLSITEKMLAMAETMPPEERAKMPVDLADQHDHYIYGWPKK